MADNVTLPGVGSNIATKEVDGAHEQVMYLDETQAATLATAAKQDALQSAVEALQTAVGLLAKLTDTQPVSGPLTDTQLRNSAVPVSLPVSMDASKVSTLNSGSGVHTGAADNVLVFTGQWEDVLDYSSVVCSANVPDADSWYVLAEFSDDASTVINSGYEVNQSSNYWIPPAAIKHRYIRATLHCTITDEAGTGEHTYSITTAYKKHDICVYPFGVDFDDGTPARLNFRGSGLLTTFSEDFTTYIGRIISADISDAVFSAGTGATGSLIAPKFAAISASSSGNNTIVAAVEGKKIRVLSAVLSFSGTVNAAFQSGAGGTTIGGLYYGVANTQVVLPYNKLGWFETAAGALLNLNLSGAVAVSVNVVYIEV